MNLLIYGGCHAAILKALIDDLGPPDRHTVDALINFQLIASGQPFPYEDLARYDAVLFSPIENKGSYNTIHLVQACADAGVAAIGFPWLEWRGYTPTAVKGEFWGQRQWFFPDLFELRPDFAIFKAFAAFVRAEYPSNRTILSNSRYSTKMLVELENRNECPIRISSLIEERFRDRRLFITPDHPSIVVYRSVIEQAERILGTRLVTRWPEAMPEPQTEERTPMLPRVEACHDLRFTDPYWRATNQPARNVDLDAYLALYFFHDGHELATARCSTRIFGKPRMATAPEPIEIPPDTRVLIRRSGAAEDPDHFAGDIVAPISVEPVSGRLAGRHVFRKEDWECRV